jgi:hypothetical protein
MKDRQTKFAEVNPNPVLSFGSDGVSHFVNPATSKLLRDLGLVCVDDILPGDHKELVRTCLKTGVSLFQECEAGGRTITWSYQSAADGDEIYIYGHDISDYQSATSDALEFPRANPSPVLSYGTDGELHFVNPATSELLLELGMEDVGEILPREHKELAAACLKASTALIKECKVAGLKYTSMVMMYLIISPVLLTNWIFPGQTPARCLQPGWMASCIL